MSADVFTLLLIHVLSAQICGGAALRNVWEWCLHTSSAEKQRLHYKQFALTSLLITVTCADFPASSSPNLIFFSELPSLPYFSLILSYYAHCHFYFDLMEWIVPLSAHTPFLLSPSSPFTFLAFHPAPQLLYIAPTFVAVTALLLSITCFLLFLEWQYSFSVAFISQPSHTRKGKIFPLNCYFCSCLNMDSYFTDHALFLVMGGVRLAVPLRHLFQNI